MRREAEYDASEEAVLHMPTIPNSKSLETLRDVLKIKKIREVSPEVAERLKQMDYQKRPA